MHGLDPKTAIIQVSPKVGQFTLETEDILNVIRAEGDSIALILFSGVQYYTGQWFDMESITREGHAKVCL